MPLIRVPLVGNPNVGKTSILNFLAGTNLKIGNWPGVTIEKRVGKVFVQNYEIELIDLPGVYTIEQATSEDEAITINFLRKGDYEVILHVIESPRLERDLYLTTQLLELNKPIIVALNMSDEAEALGIHIDERRFSELFNIKVLKTNGRTGEGVKALLPAIVESFERNLTPHFEILSFGHLTEGSEEERRLALVKGISAEITKRDLFPKKTLTESFDRFLLHPFFGFIFLILILYYTFKIVFDLSSPFVDFIDGFVQDFLSPATQHLLLYLGAPLLISRFFSEALFGGLGVVLSFLPLIFIIYLFLTLLETSGYLPRVAFLMDRFTHRVGLHGQSVIPLMLGFGCNVPAILATRTLQDRSDRLLVMAMIPFMPCSARLVVFSFFCLIFFDRPALLILALYLVGLFVAFLTSVLLRKSFLKKQLAHFVMDLPPYRLPSIRVVWSIVLLHVKSFIVRAGTVIFAISVAIWLILNLPPQVQNLEESYGGKLGKIIAPLFEPLGLGDWRIATSLIPAFLAREAILSNLAVILKAQEPKEETFDFEMALKAQGEKLLLSFKEALFSLSSLYPKSLEVGTDDGLLRGEIKKVFSSASALSFLFFVLIYNSCVATFVTMWREGSKSFALLFLGYSFALAWTFSFLIYTFFS
ncbi:MAG: ferrous iron transport protein B [Caldimicrobium sp.]|nr:ferrous iron transport protein B [Caldimicrobium sp.]MCX7872979.1 ferrous iron transport protein B [Caldimicrobium sp.]MDW8094598.1 ferrous iron transport protein B [Caldimicrobium sp.]